MPLTLGALAALTFIGLALAVGLWPAHDPEVVEHAHPDLAPDHPHLREHRGHGHRHAHAFVIDDVHRGWPAASPATGAAI
jgi:hypothetical protein